PRLACAPSRPQRRSCRASPRRPPGRTRRLRYHERDTALGVAVSRVRELAAEAVGPDAPLRRRPAGVAADRPPPSCTRGPHRDRDDRARAGTPGTLRAGPRTQVAPLVDQT